MSEPEFTVVTRMLTSRALATIQASIGVAPAAPQEEDVEMQSEETTLPADVEKTILETNQA